MTGPNDSDLLARLDERTKGMSSDIAEIKAGMSQYVTHTEFGPVRSLVFGAVALILVGFISALLFVTGLKP